MAIVRIMHKLIGNFQNQIAQHILKFGQRRTILFYLSNTQQFYLQATSTGPTWLQQSTHPTSVLENICNRRSTPISNLTILIPTYWTFKGLKRAGSRSSEKTFSNPLARANRQGEKGNMHRVSYARWSLTASDISMTDLYLTALIIPRKKNDS